MESPKRPRRNLDLDNLEGPHSAMCGTQIPVSLNSSESDLASLRLGLSVPAM